MKFRLRGGGGSCPQLQNLNLPNPALSRKLLAPQSAIHPLNKSKASNAAMVYMVSISSKKIPSQREPLAAASRVGAAAPRPRSAKKAWAAFQFLGLMAQDFGFGVQGLEFGV